MTTASSAAAEKKQPIVMQPKAAQTLAESTVYLKLRFGRFGNTKKVSTSQITVDADKNSIRVSKRLLESKELTAIRDLDLEIKRYVDSICVPFDTGIRLCPDLALERVITRLEEYAVERSGLVKAFIAVYPRLCEDASQRLRGLHNPTDYHDADEAASEFFFTWQILSFGTPEKLKTINKTIFKKEAEKAQQQVQQAAEDITALMRESLAGLVETLRDRLTDDGSGKTKQLRTSTVKNLQEFLETFDLRNVTGDGELQKVVAQARAVISGLDRDAMAESEVVKDRVRKGLGEVSEILGTMIVDRPTRKFNLED